MNFLVLCDFDTLYIWVAFKRFQPTHFNADHAFTCALQMRVLTQPNLAAAANVSNAGCWRSIEGQWSMAAMGRPLRTARRFRFQ